MALNGVEPAITKRKIMGTNSSQGKKGGKKIGRLLRSPSHKRYNTEMRWIRNGIKKLKRHLKIHPNDTVALRALAEKG